MVRALIALCLGAVCASGLGLGFGAFDAEPVAWMNGIAAVISAVAVLVESRNSRADIHDLQIRVKVLESK